MYQIIVEKTGKAVKDVCSRKPFSFENPVDANIFADSLYWNSVTGATAFNRIRPTKYIVKPIK